MKTFILLSLSIFPQLLLANPVLIVTDIDDTIKVSHVLNKESAVRNAIETKNAFMGTPELLTALSKIEGATPIHYLSNAPELIMRRSHEKFIRENKFPQGELLLSEKLIAKEHKVNALREMIKTYAPKEMILIGDNGEKDNEVYDQIRREFPEIGGPTYIHLAYSQRGHKGNYGKPLLGDQIGWATSLDLAYDLLIRGYINVGDYTGIISAVEDRAIAEKEDLKRDRQIMFPEWFDCRDFSAPVLPNIKAEMQKKIEDRCSRSPLN
jgi:hypothetical protein